LLIIDSRLNSSTKRFDRKRINDQKSTIDNEIRALHGAIQRFSRPLGVVFRRERIRPEDVELIAVVHHDVERTLVPRDRGHLTQAGGESSAACLLRLSWLALIELPDAGVLLE
jgi:hypothetical protein